MKTAKSSKVKKATLKIKDLGGKKDVKGGDGSATFPGGEPRKVSTKTMGGLPQA